MRARLVAAALMAVLLAGCGGTLHRAARPSTSRGSLQDRLALLVQRAFVRPTGMRPRVITSLNVNPGGACFTATRNGPCSLTPCIVPAQAVAPRPVPAQAGLVRAAPVQAPAPADGRCPPGTGTSQVLRVDGP